LFATAINLSKTVLPLADCIELLNASIPEIHKVPLEVIKEDAL
jgi:hypothetical protein